MNMTDEATTGGQIAPVVGYTPSSRLSILRIIKSPLTARLAFPVVALAVWIVSLSVIGASSPYVAEVLPTPAGVLRSMWNELIDPFVPGVQSATRVNVYATFALSLYRLGLGFCIAMTLGTAIGLMMGLSKAADALFHDWTMALLAFPALVWALFGSMVLGFGNALPVIVVVLTGIPFVIINVREGVRNTPVDLFDMARSFDMPRRRITRHVLLPSLSPFMFAAARYALSIGWKGLVVAEVFGGKDGAGWTIKFWYDAHRVNGVVAYALFFIIFALVLEKVVFGGIAARVFKWRPKTEP